MKLVLATAFALTVALAAIPGGGSTPAFAKKCSQTTLNACTSKCTTGTAKQKNLCISECLIKCSEGVP